MSNSHKNTSSGGSGKGNAGAHFSKIGEHKKHTPPAGASNSYESVRKKIDGRDDSSLSKGNFTREKMSNK
jgi:hypothetical protein